MSAETLDVPDEQRVRQAAGSLGGYAHQLVTTLAAWMRMSSGDQLLIEVAEDFAVLANGALTMTQVKRETGSSAVTLRRNDAKKAIVSLWQFGEANPGLDVRLHFLTTAQATNERGTVFPDGLNGIAFWARAAMGADVEPLRKFLLGLEWPDNLSAFLADASADELRSRLLGRIVWLTGSEQTDVLLDSLAARLGSLAVSRGMTISDGERALPLLLFRILEALFQPERRLTSIGFEKAWEQATTFPVPMSVARQMMGRAAGPGDVPTSSDLALEHLPQRLSRRVEMVDRLAEVATSGTIPWIHGSSGLGKSRLAHLLADRFDGVWHIVRLRGLPPVDMRQSVREALAALDCPGLTGVIFDDLPVPLGEPLRHWVRALATEAARLKLKLVVTSERAPLAPVGSDLSPWRIESVAAPYLTVSEVAEIITSAGGDADGWSQILHLTCGGGHPLFVDARIAGLASRGWPRDERMSGLINAGDVAELDEVRTTVALRLLNELDADTHTLLLRLSIFAGRFDRKLVLAVAEAHRPLARPGPLLEFLIGPWIEGSGHDRFKISPLLGSAGETGLSDPERDAVRMAIIDHLIARRPLHVDFLSLLLLHSLVVRHLRGLAFVAGAVLTSDDRKAVARACIPLAFLQPNGGGRLVPEHPGISANLRIAQVVAVTSEPSHTALEDILAAADAEFAQLPEPMRSGSRFTMLVSVLAGDDLDATPRVWMPRLLEYVAIIEGGLLLDEFLQGLKQPDLGGLRQDQFFFMLRANKIADVATLEELFVLLDNVAPERRSSWLSAGPILVGGPPLFIQSAWSKQAMAGTLDATVAAETYRNLAARAEQWAEPVAAVECHRAVAVLLDEYLDDKEAALRQLDRAETLHPGDARLTRTRATVLAHSGRHSEAHDLLAAVKIDYSRDEPLERALMLQAAATSAARSGLRSEAADLYLEAHVASEGVMSLHPGVRVGLLCDAAVELGAAEDWAGALRVVGDAHLAAEALAHGECEGDRRWHAVQAVSQVGQWLNARHEGRESLALQDHPGNWSLLTPNLPDDRSGAVSLDVGLACAALLETRLRLGTQLAERFDAREHAGKVSPFSALALRRGQIAAAVDRRDTDRFLAILPRLVATIQAAHEASRTDTLYAQAWPAFSSPPDWVEAEAEIARLFSSELLGELLLDGDRAAFGHTADQLARFTPALAGLVQPNCAGSDYTSSALSAIAWLQQPGFPDGPSLVQVNLVLFQWLAMSSRTTLRLRVWVQVRNAWRSLIGAQHGGEAHPAARPLQTALDADGADLADFATVFRAGALLTGTAIPTQAEAILARFAPKRDDGATT